MRSYKGRHRLKDQQEINRILGLKQVPARTLAQIRMNLGSKVDTLPIPRWPLSFWERVWAVGLFIELTTIRKQVR